MCQLLLKSSHLTYSFTPLSVSNLFSFFSVDTKVELTITKIYTNRCTWEIGDKVANENNDCEMFAF